MNARSFVPVVRVQPLRLAAVLLGGLFAAAAQAQLTLPYAGSTNSSADGLKVTNTGTGRALTGYATNGASNSSAVMGVSTGGGAGLTGISNGTRGPAGKFEVQSVSNDQPGVTITVKGRGNGIISTVQREPGSGVDSAAVAGRNNLVSGYGYGGDFRGGFVGIYASALNGYGLYASAPPSAGYAGYFSGNVYIAGNLTYTSDREQKTDARDVDGAEILDRLARLPVESWALSEQPEVRHVGPYAQDFRAAFGLGSDDRSISPVDVSGVALVAVQELTRRLAQQDEQIRALKAQVDELLAAARR